MDFKQSNNEKDSRKYSLLIPRVLCFFWRIIGLCPFILVDSAEPIRFSCTGISWTMIITLTYVIIYIRAVVNRVNFALLTETPMTIVSDFSGLSVEFLVVISAWLNFAFRQNKIQRILKSFKNINETLKAIGVDQDFKKIVKTAKIHTFCVNFIWISLFCCDHLLLADHEAFNLNIWIPFNFPRVVTHNVVVMLIDALLVARKMFNLLNHKMRSLSKKDSSRPFIIIKKKRKSQNNCIEIFDRPNTLEVYGRIHAELTTLTKMIVDFFSITIILTLLVHLIQMSSDLYLFCMRVKNLTYSNWREGAECAQLGCWFFVHLVQTVVIMAVSDSISSEANLSGSVLHEMLTSGHPQKYLNAAEVLSIRLLQRRLNISLYGLIEMKLSVLYRIVGMVGTYITVMMQLDSLNIQQAKVQMQQAERLNTSVTVSP